MSIEKVIPLPISSEKVSLAWAWFHAARPRTFTMSLIPFLVGTMLAWSQGAAINPWLTIVAILSAIAIQIGTHFVNDAIDFRRGADKKGRFGPIRLIQRGLQSASQVYKAGLLAYLAAFVLAIPLMTEGGTPFLWIILASILCGYCYTGGPFPLAYTGLSELFVLIFYGWIATGSIYYLQGAEINWQVLLAGTQIGLLAMIPLAINNYRDYEVDLFASKKTLIVRFGPAFGRYEIAFFCFCPFILNFFWLSTHPQAVLYPLVLLPLAMYITYFVNTYPPSRSYSQVFGLSALLHLCFGILLCLGL